MTAKSTPARLVWLLAVVLVLPSASPAAGPWEYETGGPLAGVKLPPFPTQHGEPPGQPGVLLEPGEDGEPVRPIENQPELWLYNGAVEHYRTYWHKYCPVRSFFDRQSMVKNFVAPGIPGAEPDQVEQYAEPVYYVPRQDEPLGTGNRREPVPVVRCKPGDPVFRLDFGELGPGMYCVRVIGAVPTEKLRPFLLPVFVEMSVNDGLKGETGRHRLRIGYQDAFYSVAELYFHAPARRRYQAELTLGDGSLTDLLVHNVTLDDALAGCERRAVKRRMTWHSRRRTADAEEPAEEPRSKEERLRRDALIWQGLAHPNVQLAETRYGRGEQPRGSTLARGAPGMTVEQIDERYGRWVDPARGRPFDADRAGVLMVNEKLGLEYTMADLAAGRALPDPFPHKADGAGLFFPDPRDPTKGHAYWPVARAAEGRLEQYLGLIRAGADSYLAHGESELVRDAAVALVRFAYQFPTLDCARALKAVTNDSWFRNRTLLRRRVANQNVYGSFIEFHEPLVHYDGLFDYLKDNRELAESIGRFVPWVKSPDDVIELLDVFLVQTAAKRVLRYQWYGDGRQPARIAELAVFLGDNSVTDPWLEWMFHRTFYYPYPSAGIQDLMISNTDRDGRSPIGSRSYVLGDFSAGRIAGSLSRYLEAGGNPRFDLVDRAQYPKVVVSTYFWPRHWTAGLYFPRIGSVTGADKAYAHHFYEKHEAFDVVKGWAWTADPQFAYVLWHYGNHDAFTPEELKRIEQAAKEMRRPPWLENRSRVLPGWAAYLESGIEHDDFRFRRSVVVRVGVGHGHAHNDSLDLQLHAHGMPMTVDGGQRGGYSEPGDSHTRVHNVVEVDGLDHNRHCWVRALSDAPGARYLMAQSVPPGEATLFRRQVALIDVSEGSGSRALTPEQMGGRPQDLPSDVVTPQSCVFDVFRTRGGRRHTYCFHASVSELLEINSQGRVPIAQAPAADREYLGLFGALPETKHSGTAPGVLEATWPLVRESERRYGTEKYMMQSAYDPDAPQKFTRLSLFGQQGARAMEADLLCKVRDYQLTCLMVQRRTDDTSESDAGLESVFPAVIEPYAGEPFVLGKRSLPIPDNETDALRAVAVELKLPEGRTDVCFADGRPEKTRRVGPLEIAGEFAHYSEDAQGLRQATLVGGTLLDAPGVRIEPAERERRADVVEVDYFGKTIRIDARWPASRRPCILEIGALPENDPHAYTTSYTAVETEPSGAGTKITLLRGADLFRSRITGVDPAAGKVTCALGLPTPVTGVRHGLVASNEALTKFWRAASVEETTFELDGPPVEPQDFGAEGALRLWEYGVGDQVRASTSVSLRRVEPNNYEIETDVAVRVSLTARRLTLSRDGKPLPASASRSEDGRLTVELPAGDAAVRVETE